MRNFFKDEGIILKKNKLLKDNRIITIFSRTSGKIALSAFGVRKITSRRISHLETGYYIRFNYQIRGEYKQLRETELIYGYSGIKKNFEKTQQMFMILFILQSVLAENQPEEKIFTMTLDYLKKINNQQEFSENLKNQFLVDILQILGFIDDKEKNNIDFNPIIFIENLLQRRLSTVVL